MGVYINAKNSSAENFVFTSLKRLTMEEARHRLELCPPCGSVRPVKGINHECGAILAAVGRN